MHNNFKNSIGTISSVGKMLSLKAFLRPGHGAPPVTGILCTSGEFDPSFLTRNGSYAL